MAKAKQGVSDLGISEVQESFDAMHEKGFYGDKVDPTPNENYSLEGGADPKSGSTGSTPESDAELGLEARNASLGDPFENFKASQDPNEVIAANEAASSSDDEKADEGK